MSVIATILTDTFEAFVENGYAGTTTLEKGRSVTGFANSEEAAIGLTHVVPFLVEDMLRENGGIYSNGNHMWSSMAI
jgi:hypothetical protein